MIRIFKVVSNSEADAKRLQEALRRDPASEDDREINRLLTTVNEASAAARTAWMFFLGLMAYFLVAIASVSHQDLLLNRPVHLPFLDIDIELEKFFRFSPLVLLIIHFGVYLQHVLLSRKAHRLHLHLLERERLLTFGDRGHPMRMRVHSYFFTQIYVGAQRGPALAAFLRTMNALSFVLLPISLFLAFQTNFLPYHDVAMTIWHRIYLLADLLLIFLMQHFMREATGSSGIAATIARQFMGMVKFLPSLAVLAASWLVVTVPGEPADRLMTRIAGVPVPYEYEFGISGACVNVFGRSNAPVCSAIFGKSDAEQDKDRPVRRAFILTAMFFEGKADYGKGESSSWFSRNLVVPDRDLSVTRTEFQKKEDVSGVQPDAGNIVTTERVKLSLRGRDLRYAVFDRSNFTGADFTFAELEGASFRGAILTDSIFSCAIKPIRSETGGDFQLCTKLFATQFEGAKMQRADLRGACALGTGFRSADLTAATFFKANLSAADFTLAQLDGAILAETKLQGAKMVGAELRNASLRFANLEKLDEADIVQDEKTLAFDDDCKDALTERSRSWYNDHLLRFIREKGGHTDAAQAHMELADFRLANLRGADLTRARLVGADLQLSHLQGAVLEKADLTAADLSYSSLQGSDLSNALLDGATLNHAKLDGAIVRSARLRGASLSNAKLAGADLRYAEFENTRMEDADLTAADIRCVRISGSSEGLARAINPTADFYGHVSSPPRMELRNKIAKRQSDLLDLRLKLREFRLDTPQLRLTGPFEKRLQIAVSDNELEESAVALNCPHGTALSEASKIVLTEQLAQVICSDAPNVKVIGRGVIKRIVDSEAPDLPDFQSDTAALLAKLKTHIVLREQTAKEKLGQETCISKLDSSDVFSLSLLVAREAQSQRGISR